MQWLKTHGDDPTPFTYFLLHVASERSVYGPMECGLVLHRTTAHGTYTQVGFFIIPLKSEYPDSGLEDAFNGRLDTSNSEVYLALDSDGKYTIDVVEHNIKISHVKNTGCKAEIWE